MSLAINVDAVSNVLLADGWHEVAFGDDDVSSFLIDSYEFTDPALPFPAHGGGDSGICAKGFEFLSPRVTDTGSKIFVAGPLSAILAVRHVVAAP